MSTSTLDYLRHLFCDTGLVELRHQTDQGWETSWHTTPEDLLAAARIRAWTGNLFTSLNHVSARPNGAIRNDHIDFFLRLLFDLDPVRPRNTPSTDSELKAAYERAITLQRHMSGHGWPIPASGMSGNGHHLLYRALLPNTAEVREQLSAIYMGLGRRVSDDTVSFDTSVKNPGRICTLYGSTKRKGQPTAERPHRKSWIAIPREWQQVLPRQIDALANLYAKEKHSAQCERTGDRPGASFSTGQGDYRSLDIVALFRAQKGYVRPLGGNVHGVRCPWLHEHSSPSPLDGGDTVIFEADGSWPGFHCKHAHCTGRGIHEVIALWPDADNFCDRVFREEVRSRIDS